VVVRKARTPRTSRAPFTNKGKKAVTRTTFLLRADVADVSDSIGHSFLLLRLVLVCARVNQPNKQG
jgi:hypothetical protein